MIAVDPGSTLTENSQTINIFFFGKRRRAVSTLATPDSAMDAPVKRCRNSKSVGDITQSQVMATLLKQAKGIRWAAENEI